MPLTAENAALALNGGTPVSQQQIPFMSPALTREDISSATAVLESGMLRQASKCAELEERFGALSEARHAMTCANGTCALQLAYGALLTPGSEVIVPAWTYIATAAMIVAAGCKPVFCDVLEDTFQIDPTDIEARITDRTCAIACTHLYGCPVDVEAVQAIAQRHGLKVIYDAAQAHLARYRHAGVGAYGDACTFSFYATKNLATGEGGMVLTNDDDTADTIKALRSHGETDKYLHTSIGFNYRMNDITAAIGCSRLDRLESQTEARRRVARRYDEMLADIPEIIAPATTRGAEPVYHLYTCKLDLGALTCGRDTFVGALRAEGVPTAVHYPRSVTRQPAFAGFVGEHPPVSDALGTRVFSLPMHHALDDAQTAAVGEALAKVAAAYRA